jgi:hypothetical protein
VSTKPGELQFNGLLALGGWLWETGDKPEIAG